MSRFQILPKTDNWPDWQLNLLAVIVFAVGLLIRLWAATSSFVNPDEAYHALLSSPATFDELYKSAVRSPHPPLFIILLHYIRQITTSDLGIRFIPLVAGSVMPLVVYRWVSRGWNCYAGLGAMSILMLAPVHIRLSSEARAYMMAMLFMACALLFMDRAIETSSKWRMAGFAICLYGAIYSDYSAAFFVVASGVYFLMRITEKKVTLGVRITWELSQVGAIILYSILWVTQVNPMRAIATTRTDVDGWLRGAYLQEGQNIAGFFIANTAKQFALLMPLLVPAVTAMLFFGVGLWFLWRKSPPDSIWHSRATVMLILIPFVATFAAACVHMFPYGRSRHTIFLSLFIATGVSISIERFARSWVVPLVILALVLTPVWHIVEGQHHWETGNVAFRKQHMDDAIDFLKKSVPPNALVLTEAEMRVVLAYYMDRGVHRPELESGASEEVTGDYRLLATRWAFATVDDVRNDLRLMRGQYGLGPNARIWILDGGFNQLLEQPFKELHDAGELPDLFQFENAMLAVLTPPGFLWEEPGPEDRIPDPEEAEVELKLAVPAYQ